MSVSTTSVIIAGTNYSDFPNARTLNVGQGLFITDNGPQSNFIISTSGNLASLVANQTSGYISYNTDTQTYTSRSIAGGLGIQVLRNTGVEGNTQVNQLPGTVLQRINVLEDGGAVLGSYSNVEFRAGSNTTVEVTDEGSGAKAVVTVGNSQGGTVTGINNSSTTGLIIAGGPVTGSGTITINLPGTGAASAVVTGDMLVGDAGSYVPVAIGSVNQVWTSDGNTASWAFAPGTGTVTSINNSSTTGLIIAGGPVTESGTITINLPGTGAASAVVTGDMLLGDAGSYVPVAIGLVGQVWTSDGNTASWQAPATNGTVTSVGLSSSNGFITIGGSPVTTSGTLAMTINTLPITLGGTGQITASDAFDALAPAGLDGDMLYYQASTSSWVALLNDFPGKVLSCQTVGGSVWPRWVNASVAVSSSNSFITVSGSPINNSGTITLTINTLSVAKGGTGQTTASAGFNALAPTTTTGDTIYRTAGATNARLAIGTTGQVYTVASGIPAWTSTNKNSGAAATVGLATGIVGTTTINSTAVTTSSIINLTIADMAGAGIVTAPIITAPAAARVNATSFDITVFLVGGVGEATSVDVYWQIVNPN